MPTLLEVQTQMARAVTGEGAVPDFVRDDGIAAADRLSIHSSTFLSGLTNALRLTYPAIEKLVGAEFFEGAARYFIDQCPPDAAYLNDYGDGFAQFLEGFVPAAALAYLPDVARLEWAVNIALHARDENPLDLAALADADGDVRLMPKSCLSLLQSPYPVDAIWRATLGDDEEALSAVQLNDGPVFMVIAREADVVKITRLKQADFEATQLLCIGTPLGEVLVLLPEQDGVALLAEHLAAGRFTAIRKISNQEQQT